MGILGTYMPEASGGAPGALRGRLEAIANDGCGHRFKKHVPPLRWGMTQNDCDYTCKRRAGGSAWRGDDWGGTRRCVLPALEDGDEDGGEEGGDDAVGSDGYSGEGGGDGVLGDDAGGSDAAAGGACGEAPGGGFADLEAVQQGVDADGDQDAADDGQDGGERWDAADALGNSDGDGGGEGLGRHGEGDGLGAAEQADDAVAGDEADEGTGAECGHHGPEAAAHVLERAHHGDGEGDGGGAEHEVDELRSGEVVLVGKMRQAQGDADDDDGDEDGVGERVADALLDLDSEEIGAEGEHEREEGNHAGRDGEGEQ